MPPTTIEDIMETDFDIALAECHAHIRAGTEDTPEGQQAFFRFLDTAPPELLAQLHAEICRRGLAPKPDGYLDGDRPFYSVKTIADHCGVSIEKVCQVADEMEAAHPGRIIHPDLAGINRIH
jgi:hypothetical protein